jgi:hypothetical protein
MFFVYVGQYITPEIYLLNGYTLTTIRLANEPEFGIAIVWRETRHALSLPPIYSDFPTPSPFHTHNITL